MKEIRLHDLDLKWQKIWAEQGLYSVKNGQDKPKYYCLDMFPYPSGTGLHVGHPKGYIATDVVARSMMMKGYNVLHPMGWDAFGLPAENYALKTGVHPAITTTDNIAIYKRQLQNIGFTYDWNREINTTDPAYYRWTQWAFGEMFKRGLVYESHEPINWCPTCKTGLANEDLDNGRCERCGTPVEKKPLRQWVIRITDYAERLLEGIDKLSDWEHAIKEMQKNWIGKSEGAEIRFSILGNDLSIKVYTTRPDTIFGATYLVLAPEHPLVNGLKDAIGNWQEVQGYIAKVKDKSELERTDLNKDKTGVELVGVKAVNPANSREIPIFIADYVLTGYGTGAIMAVPAHDERDHEFAVKYDLPIIEVIKSDEKKSDSKCFCGEGIAIHSDFLDGLTTKDASDTMVKWLEDNNLGSKKINYKLRDWVFGRQRYWGEPIPLIYCENCKAKPENDGELLNPGWMVDDRLPVKLPEVDHYEPSGTGESPLAIISDWVNVSCPRCGGKARRETNTMPQWAGSSWYYLRYCDPRNSSALIGKEADNYWLGDQGVDLYVGGAEHATRHLVYARFWHKFLSDIGVVASAEPFIKLRHVGLILAEDGRKMSKRWNNTINPDDICNDYGADCLRVYEMFMGPFDQPVAWNTNGLIGARKFLSRLASLRAKIDGEPTAKDSKSLLHKTIKKVSDDIEDFKFNTAISALMILVNKLNEDESVGKNEYSSLVQLIAPFAPHLAEELWQELGNDTSIFLSAWPKSDLELVQDDSVVVVIQVNAKVRDQMSVGLDLSDDLLLSLALERDKIKAWVAKNEILKTIIVKNKLINIVTDEQKKK